MKIEEALKNTKEIHYAVDSPQVIETAAGLITDRFTNIAATLKTDEFRAFKGILNLGIFNRRAFKEIAEMQIPDNVDRFIYIRLSPEGSGWIIASHDYYLYGFVSYLLEQQIHQPIGEYESGKLIEPSFHWQRVSYDYFLTQEGRIQQGLDRETYIRKLARCGFTHIEVNGLAFPMALETGPKGETYPMFYTYCPALDQFVHSELNEGLYPYYYLSANFEYLKTNAEIAQKYGMKPGILCFEPRSVPEEFFQKYPMLRGARVDHPFRSFEPRYNMTIAHPKVLEHYSDMLGKIMSEIPELSFMSVWSNDSGAGFEHTKSLYVGRNGGAYLIREWKDDDEIARMAGKNAVRFLRNLTDTGRKYNPDFKCMVRMESFYGEHDTVWEGLGEGLEVETVSLAARGWDMPYHHPKYDDIKAINGGTVYQMQFDSREKELNEELHNQGSAAHYYNTFGPRIIFEPLLGIPYPTLTYRRLKLFYDNNVRLLAQGGGACPEDIVPFNVNYEVNRAYQFNPELDIEDFIVQLAIKWAGGRYHSALIYAWRLTEAAILTFPIITPLYCTHGFTWYRLWARPFVPNIEAIPLKKRRYYEEFMCTTPHNPNNVDLSRDVLFQLTTFEKSVEDLRRIDENLWHPLNEAIRLLDEESYGKDKTNIIFDQLIRLKALKCWFMTQRNVAAWIVGVYGYMNSSDKAEKKRYNDLLVDMMEKEIRNSHDLIDLLLTDVQFMAMTDKGETPLVHGSNLPELLKRRIEIMREHINDKPFIDMNYMEREAGEST